MIPYAFRQVLERNTLVQVTLYTGGADHDIGEIVAAAQTHLGVHRADLLTLEERPAVKELRAMLERLQLRPYYGTRSLFVIRAVDQWSEELSNTLLKTIEEPPPHLWILLFANHESSVLETVRSRAVRFRILDTRKQSGATDEFFHRPLVEQYKEIASLLENQSAKEVLQGWLASASERSLQRTLLDQLTQIETRPVNGRLATESSVFSWYAQSRKEKRS